MRIVFRSDASTIIGSGHIMRCLTLAEELQNNGVDITFISRAHLGNLNALIYKKGINVIEIPKPNSNETNISTTQGDNYEEWLGITQKKDAEETIALLGDSKPDWLIVDHYGLDANWENQLRPYVKHIMVIDDLADRKHDCDVLLDQNYSLNGIERYQRKISDHAKRLLGPEYGLLRPEYRKARQDQQIRNGTIQKVLIFMGSSDPQNLTAMALSAFKQPELISIFLDLVIGVNYPKEKEIRAECNTRGRAECHTMLPHLADLMAGADLCIGSGGSTTWERLCMGLPTIVITTGENQVPSSEALAQKGYLEYLGPASKVSDEMLTEKTRLLINSPEILKRQSIAGQELVDGMGVQRVVNMLFNK